MATATAITPDFLLPETKQEITRLRALRRELIHDLNNVEMSLSLSAVLVSRRQVRASELAGYIRIPGRRRDNA